MLEVNVRKLLTLARERRVDDPVLRDRVAHEWIEQRALRLTNYRALTMLMKTGMPGPEGSVSKLHLVGVEPAPDEARARDPRPGRAALERRRDGYWQYQQLRSRGNTIEAGTSEILRNIIAERVLGLPRSRGAPGNARACPEGH